MATPLPLSPIEVQEVFSKAIATSAILKLSAPRLAPANRDTVYFTSDHTDGSFRAPGSSTPVTDGTYGKFTVKMGSMSKALEYYEIDAEDAPKLIEETKTSMPKVLSRTFERSFFKDLVPTSPFDVAGITELTVDETPESWQAVVDHIGANGYNCNGFVLDFSFKALIRRAVTEGVIGMNPLSVSIGNDGEFLVADVPVYFRDLHNADGSIKHGLAADFTQIATAHTGEVTSNIWGKDNDLASALAGVTTVVSDYRIGAGIADKKAIVTLVAATV
jgi:hypothetical protein